MTNDLWAATYGRGVWRVTNPVSAGPVANFSFTPASPSSGQTVQFTDTSTGGPTSWTWNFGDGFGSTIQNPTHAFLAAGAYPVALTVSTGRLDGITKTVTVASGGAEAASRTRTRCASSAGATASRPLEEPVRGWNRLDALETKLTDLTGAFWIASGSTYEYAIRFNPATNNGRIWVAILTFTDVEFWIKVTDTHTGQFKEYHSVPGNKTTDLRPVLLRVSMTTNLARHTERTSVMRQTGFVATHALVVAVLCLTARLAAVEPWRGALEGTGRAPDQGVIRVAPTPAPRLSRAPRRTRLPTHREFLHVRQGA